MVIYFRFYLDVEIDDINYLLVNINKVYLVFISWGFLVGEEFL